MERRLIYKDKAGNKLYEDIDRRLVVLNNKGKSPTDIRPFIKQPTVKKAINNFYDGNVRTKLLCPKDTKALNLKIKGGIYK